MASRAKKKRAWKEYLGIRKYLGDLLTKASPNTSTRTWPRQ